MKYKIFIEKEHKEKEELDEEEVFNRQIAELIKSDPLYPQYKEEVKKAEEYLGKKRKRLEEEELLRHKIKMKKIKHNSIMEQRRILNGIIEKMQKKELLD